MGPNRSKSKFIRYILNRITLTVRPCIRKGPFGAFSFISTPGVLQMTFLFSLYAVSSFISVVIITTSVIIINIS
jgi:hypothetical protein